MKILATAKRPRVGGYGEELVVIAEITELELLKVANKAGYREQEDFAKTLAKLGDYPLAEGYDFKADIVKAVKDMTTAYESFHKASAALAGFATLMRSKEDTTTEANAQ